MTNFYPPLFWFYRTEEKLIGIRPDASPSEYANVLEISRRLGYALVMHTRNEAL